LSIPSLFLILICANVTTNRLKTFRGQPQIDYLWREKVISDHTGPPQKKK
jgi:hypothetical protein